MATNRQYAPLWWDREVDDRGNRLRDDVRRSACELWPSSCGRARTTLGDVAEAAELLEAAVAHVSRCLTKTAAPPFYPPAKALLSKHFRQELSRRAGRLRRVRSVGLIEDLEALVPEALTSSSWIEEILAWHDVAKLHDKVDDRSWIIFVMRYLSHSWNEIAKKLGIAISTAKNHFRNDFKRAWVELHGPSKNGKGKCQADGKSERKSVVSGQTTHEFTGEDYFPPDAALGELEVLVAFDMWIHGEHANSERKGCPGRKQLEAVVRAKTKVEDEYTLKHMGLCAACLDEMRQIGRELANAASAG